jgi:hypothetical protein
MVMLQSGTWIDYMSEMSASPKTDQCPEEPGARLDGARSGSQHTDDGQHSLREDPMRRRA